MLRIREGGVSISSSFLSIRRGVIGLLPYDPVGVYAEGYVELVADIVDNEFPPPVFPLGVPSGSGLGVYPYGVGGTNPGVIGMTVFVGLRGDSGFLSSATPLRYVGLMSGLEISIGRGSSEVFRKKSFVEIFRLKLVPELEGGGGATGAGGGSSGVGRGYITHVLT